MDSKIQQILITFPFPIDTSKYDVDLMTLAEQICDDHRPEGMTAWPAGFGQKITRMPLTAQDDLDGVAMEFDETTFHIECFARQEYDSEIVRREKRQRRAQEEESAHKALLPILKERIRQIRKEGWSPEHDDQHTDGELAKAAACYVGWAGQIPGDVPTIWPWAKQWWKLKGRRRDLVRAAALIVAELERMDRAEAKSEAA